MKKLYLYYDGACHLCSKEISHYKSIDSAGVLGLVDISQEGFDPVKEGVSERDFNKYFHVKKENGEVLSGVLAFQAIWDTLGVFRPLSLLSKNPVGYFVMSCVYRTFAEIRPYLPKKEKESCKI